LLQDLLNDFGTIEEHRIRFFEFSYDLASFFPPGSEKDNLCRQSLQVCEKEIANSRAAPLRFWHNLAAAHWNIGESVTMGKESIWHQRKSLEILTWLYAGDESQPKLEMIRVTLVFVLLFCPDDSQRDLQLAKELSEWRKGTRGVPSDIAHVGLTYYRLRDWKRVVAWLETESKPRRDQASERRYVYLRSMAYSRLGQREKARELFAQAEPGTKADSQKFTIRSQKSEDYLFLLYLRGDAAALLGIHDFIVPLDRFCLARGYWEKGDKEQALKWYRDAVAWMDKNAPQDEWLQLQRTEAAILLGLEKPAEFQEPAVWPPKALPQASPPASGGR
jgi:hypothetical protein